MALFSKAFALSIGPQFCGSEQLRSYFEGHHDVCLPDVQDVFFFDRHIDRGARFYKSHFNPRDHVRLFMDVTTTIFDHAQAPELVFDILGPHVKLFCPLRDPVERAFAAYKHFLKYGIVSGRIQDACGQAPQILLASRYAEHLEHWTAQTERIYFLSYEQLELRRGQTLQGLCTFLELPYRQINERGAIAKFLPKIWFDRKNNDDQDVEAKQWLRSELAGETQRFQSLTGSDLFSGL